MERKKNCIFRVPKQSKNDACHLGLCYYAEIDVPQSQGG